MKSIIKIIGVALLMTAFTQIASAQVKFSAGADIGMVTNEGLGLTYGLALGGEYQIGDNMGITLQSGFSIVSNDYDGVSSSFIPYMAGFKYYFDSNEGGLYALAQIGMTSYSVSSSGGTYLSYAPGVGYLMNEHIDLGFRYHIITSDGESLNWLALRAAYQF
tara:strand:+ start:152 stop:637 length:486 start_codon:yes stop_codon:yes gene_type:complete